MTKIRCQICGGENLHSENAISVVCDDCGNRSLVIPESAILDQFEFDNVVSLHFDKNQTDCPRKSFCLNDKMEIDSDPCKVCNVIQNKFNNLTGDIVRLYEEREQFLKQHPEVNTENNFTEG